MPETQKNLRHRTVQKKKKKEKAKKEECERLNARKCIFLLLV